MEMCHFQPSVKHGRSSYQQSFECKSTLYYSKQFNSFKHSFFLSGSAHWIELSSEITSLAVFKMIIHAALNPSFVFAVVAVVWLLSVATELNMYVVWPQDL